MNEIERNIGEKLVEFQDVFQSVFRKLKRHNEFFPKTKYNLADGHILILLYLSKKGSCTASDITSYLGITSGGGTVLTDTLLNNSLINRIRSEKDRRVVLLSLTTEGEKIVEEVTKQRVGAFIQLFKDLEEAEVKKIIQIFKKLDNTLN